MNIFKTFAFLLALAPLSLRAERYKIDPAHSSVNFSIKHLLSSVDGNFKNFSGEFELDDKTAEVRNAQFSIDADSVDTRNEKRDAHLKTEDFFETSKYKTIDVKLPTTIKLKKGKPVTVTATTTVHGVTRPVPFKVTYLGSTQDPWGNTKSAFEARGIVKRKDFDLTWNKTLDTGGLLLGDEVSIVVKIEADLQKGEEKKAN